MKYQQLQRMREEEWVAQLEGSLWDIVENPSRKFDFMKETKGHSEIHYALDENALLERLIHNKLDAASCFANEEQARNNIAFALINEAREIGKWFFSEPWEVGGIEGFKRKIITVNMGLDENVGYGLDKSFQRKETDVITCVLERDYQTDSDIVTAETFGFRIITAYPDILAIPKYTRDLGKPLHLRDIVSREGIFKDDMEKLAFFNNHIRKSPEIFYLPVTEERREPAVLYSHPYKDGKISIRIDEDEARIRQVIPGNIKKLNMAEYLFKCPEEAKTLNLILNERDNIILKRFDLLHQRNKDIQQER